MNDHQIYLAQLENTRVFLAYVARVAEVNGWSSVLTDARIAHEAVELLTQPEVLERTLNRRNEPDDLLIVLQMGEALYRVKAAIKDVRWTV